MDVFDELAGSDTSVAHWCDKSSLTLRKVLDRLPDTRPPMKLDRIVRDPIENALNNLENVLDRLGEDDYRGSERPPLWPPLPPVFDVVSLTGTLHDLHGMWQPLTIVPPWWTRRELETVRALVRGAALGLAPAALVYVLRAPVLIPSDEAARKQRWAPSHRYTPAQLVSAADRARSAGEGTGCPYHEWVHSRPPASAVTPAAVVAVPCPGTACAAAAGVPCNAAEAPWNQHTARVLEAVARIADIRGTAAG